MKVIRKVTVFALFFLSCLSGVAEQPVEVSYDMIMGAWWRHPSGETIYLQYLFRVEDDSAVIMDVDSYEPGRYYNHPFPRFTLEKGDEKLVIEPTVFHPVSRPTLFTKYNRMHEILYTALSFGSVEKEFSRLGQTRKGVEKFQLTVGFKAYFPNGSKIDPANNRTSEFHLVSKPVTLEVDWGKKKLTLKDAPVPEGNPRGEEGS